jgi:hypothetical protein
MAWLDKDAAAFKASDDAFIKLAVALYDDDRAREPRQGARRQAAEGLRRRAAGHDRLPRQPWRGRLPRRQQHAAHQLRQGAGPHPGADGTAWTPSPRCAASSPSTKGPGQPGGEFNAPAEQLAAIKAKHFGNYYVKGLDSVPVNFLATLDTTGGNSGSPVLNKNAELVGLLFDGTLDAVISDWDFNPKMVRSICLDARYMLWQMSTVDKTTRVLQEMGVK